MKNINEYKKIVGKEIIDKLSQRGKKFYQKHITCVSSTPHGGGVAEMLNSLISLFDDIGVDFGWRIIHGTPDFFNVTKSFHNALQGGKISLTENKKNLYEETNKRFSLFNHFKDHDLIIVHDPQPLALINYVKKSQPWIFRCHIDLSKPDKNLWTYLKTFIKKYDHMVVSSEEYIKDISLPQTIIHPAIDPLSPKNKYLPEDKINRYLRKQGINFSKPIIAQISRFDKWKDPEGVVEVFKRVRRKIDCQLVLLGNVASDDPEAILVYNKISKKYNNGRNKDIKILVNVENNDLVVNSLQRKSAVIIQKSTKEGFGLTVTEALYKGTPVVASNVGGIPLQIIDGYNGFFHQPKDYDGFAESIAKIIKDRKLREELGKNAVQYVKKNFLITRLMNDWFDLFERYIS